MSINEKIKEICLENNKVIIILSGFENSELPKKNKYFSFNIKKYDAIDIEEMKDKAIYEILDNRESSEKYLWMTGEEYQLFREHSKICNRDVVILENNIYDRQFPYRDTLSDIEKIYENLYYTDDNELDDNEKELLNNVSFFYGKIDYSKQCDRYYITYNEYDENIKKYNLYEESTIEVEYTERYPKNDAQIIELSDDEIPFLDLEMDMLLGKNKKNIVFILSSSKEKLPNRYLERINILSKIYDFDTYFSILSIKRNIIENEEEYLKILKDIYGYSSFNELVFYDNIESHSKQTIKISQAQIIDDIVIQAEKALSGEDFRDIYVTAPTGAGKSIMFQIPALYLSSKHKEEKPITLVISPLIGLMNDQVNSMKNKGINNSATINGNTPQYEKEKIIRGVKDEEIDVLYLSPETLQARSDIKMIIGERNIGIVIIDEAHIVTTWGKSFRADYWYLGIYLSKLRKKYKFPIVTFTATSIYGGKEDMYLDTRNSLNMISPISYFGDVKRNDLLMNVKYSKSHGEDYRKTKYNLAFSHLKKANEKNKKSLMYFPTVRLLIDFYRSLEINAPDIAKKTGKYYGSLMKEEKDSVLEGFKSGNIQFILATKAFGMGIDIPDITYVYHYAPTGNVVDYIQEIGRAARNKKLVKNGIACIDYLPKDMNEVKRLYGMSSIKNSEIIEVMKKVLSIYNEKGKNRNLIISPEDFKYIFIKNSQNEDSSVDNKIKTILLMIEKDFSSPKKLGYSPFVARPRSIFGNDLIFADKKMKNKLKESALSNFFTKKYDLTGKEYTEIYEVNLSEIWETHYKHMSFPAFKYALFTKGERKRLKHSKFFEDLIFSSGVEVSLINSKRKENIISNYRKILDLFEKFINKQKIDETQFTVYELGDYFKRTLKIKDKFQAIAFAQAVINSAFEFSKIKEIKFIKERSNSVEGYQRYVITQDGDIFTRFIMDEINRCINPSFNYAENDGKIITFYIRSSKNTTVDSKIAALGIGEAYGEIDAKMFSYQVIGGNDPQIYLRMNSEEPLERQIKKGEFYKNDILEDVKEKHYTSVAMLKYLFTKEQKGKDGKEKVINYTKWFWNTIEDYFMGKLPKEVSEEIYKK